jgi:hypothetical protein
MIDPKNTEPMNDSIAKTANGASKEAASSPAAYQGSFTIKCPTKEMV